MGALSQYERLLGQHDALIWGEPNGPAREEARQALARDMDALWPKLTGPERREALRRAERLYRERIGVAGG